MLTPSPNGQYKLVCFDLDGTIIDDTVFVWQTIHDHLGTSKERRKQAQTDFFAGRITYKQWAEHDLMLWREVGATRADLAEAIEGMKLMAGARETIEALRTRGLKLAVISGSLDIALDYVLPDWRSLFEFVYVNHLVFADDGAIVGIDINRYDIANKGEGLKRIAGELGLELAQCVFVGDHFNDVSAARLAGLSIAFNCKSDELAEVSDLLIAEPDLTHILEHVFPDDRAR